MTDEDRIEALEREVLILRQQLSEAMGFALYLVAGLNSENEKGREQRLSQAEETMDKVMRFTSPSRPIGEYASEGGDDE